MHRWLNETRGPTFELFRHFLRTFFDSDLVTATEHTPMALVGAVGVAMQWMFLYVQPIKMKYAYFSKLTSPGPYRDALRADELWLIALAIGGDGGADRNQMAGALPQPPGLSRIGVAAITTGTDFCGEAPRVAERFGGCGARPQFVSRLRIPGPVERTLVASAIRGDSGSRPFYWVCRG